MAQKVRSKQLTLKVTTAQLTAIVMAADNLSAMVGCGNEGSDKEFAAIVKRIDAFLKKNGYKRKYK